MVDRILIYKLLYINISCYKFISIYKQLICDKVFIIVNLY